MFELKQLSREAIPSALSKAERYRLLNEPWQAESICQDVLRIEPGNRVALSTLLLALTDQFQHGADVHEAWDVVARMQDAYERSYYSGIVCERRAQAMLQHGRHGSGTMVYESLRSAMQWYEKAEATRPPANDDALLRWNTCARLLMRHPDLQPAVEQPAEPIMSE
jgi:hypothetical protein